MDSGVRENGSGDSQRDGGAEELAGAGEIAGAEEIASAMAVCWSLTSLCHSNGHIEMPALWQ